MAVESYPAYLQAEPYSSEITRRSIYGLVQRNSSNAIGTVAGGVYYSTDLLLSAPGSGLSVNVAAGECLVPGTVSFGSTTSGYYLRNTASLNLPIATANPTNPRIDLVCATINDATYHGAINSGVIQVITGTPTTGATLSNLSGVASLPDASLLLGYVLVPTSASNITSGDLAQAQVRIAPSTALNYAAGHLATNVNLPVNALTLVLATPSLAVGVWLINFAGTIALIDNGGTDGAATATVGSGTATLEGSIAAVAPFIASGGAVASNEFPLPMTFVASVSAAAVIHFNMICAGASGGTAVASSGWSNGTLTNLTGFTALKIG